MEFTAGGDGRAGSKGATLGWMTLGATVLKVCTLDVTIGSRLAFRVKGLKGLVIGTGANTGLEIGTGAMTGLAMGTTGLAIGAAKGGTGAG